MSTILKQWTSTSTCAPRTTMDQFESFPSSWRASKSPVRRQAPPLGDKVGPNREFDATITEQHPDERVAGSPMTDPSTRSRHVPRLDDNKTKVTCR